MAELKPCPFCGGEAKIEVDFSGRVKVECSVCWCNTRSCKNKLYAIEAWNERVECLVPETYNFCHQRIKEGDKVVYIKVIDKRPYKCIGKVLGFSPKKVRIECDFQLEGLTEEYLGRVDTVFADNVICNIDELVEDFTGEL